LGECKLCPLGDDLPQTPNKWTGLTDLFVNILSLLTTPVNDVRPPGQNKLFEVSECLISEGIPTARAERITDFVTQAWRQTEFNDSVHVVECRSHNRSA